MSAALTLAIAPGYEAETFTDVQESTYAETTTMDRRRWTASVDSECVTVRITQAGASSKTEIYGIEWTERLYSPFAEGE